MIPIAAKGGYQSVDRKWLVQLHRPATLGTDPYVALEDLLDASNLGIAANELGLGTVERTLASDLRDLGVPVTRFGALETTVELSDVVSTASSAVLTSPSGGFAFAEVGDLIEFDILELKRAA